MKTVSESRPSLTRTLKNGIVIRGFYARVAGIQKGTPPVKVELFVSDPQGSRLWAGSKLHRYVINPQELLNDNLNLLEAQLKDCCIDQVPMTPKGMMLIMVLLEAFSKKRVGMLRAA